MPQQARNWCFTLQNYTEEDVARLKSLTSITYLVAGKEVSSTGTPHLQGFVQFPSPKRLKQVQSVLGRPNVHCSVAKDIEASIEYCKKDGDYFEVGQAKKIKKKGQRSELEDFKEAVRNGERSTKRLREEFSEVAAKYPRFFIDYVHDNVPGRTVNEHEYRSWQSELAETLNGESDPRTIIFVVDTKGDTGKTWFAHHFCSKYKEPERCQVMVPGKKADMAYALIAEPLIVFFDCPRSKQGDFIQYDFLEEVKNGYVFSTKYESRNKTFDPPHVVVLMNETPDMEKLSADRYHIIEL